MLSSGAVAVNIRELGPRAAEHLEEFSFCIQMDLNLPKALSVVWKICKDRDVEPAEKLTLLYDIDKILGLRLDKVKAEAALNLNSELKSLIEEREEARRTKHFARADEIRDILKSRGVEIRDTSTGTEWKKIV
jgi:cysteinyl-tRNA synthetase